MGLRKWVSTRIVAFMVGLSCVVSPSFAGEQAADFTLRDINNQEVSLSDFKGKVILMSFWATWCGPCKAIAPNVQAFSERYPSVNFYKIDVDALEELTMYAGVNCMPTFQLYKAGEHVDTLEGADATALEEMIMNKLN